MKNLSIAFLRYNIILFVFALLACNPPKVAVSVQQQYGGVISGQIVYEGEALLKVKSNPDGLLARLKDSIQLTQLVKQKISQLPQNIHFMGDGDDDCPVIVLPNQSQLSIDPASTDNRLIVNYSFGRISKRPLIYNPDVEVPLDILVPYRVRINRYSVGSSIQLFSEQPYEDRIPYTVVYLTNADRQYSCYNFVASSIYVSPN